MEAAYTNPRNLTIDNTNVEIEVARLNHAAKRDLRNYFSKYGLDRDTGAFEDVDIPAGVIEDLVIRRALKKLVIGTQQIRFDGASPVDSFPDFAMGDEEDEPDLYEEVLKTIVDRNRWLARRYPFGLVFAQYLALVQQDEEKDEKGNKEMDPTEEKKGKKRSASVTRLNASE